MHYTERSRVRLQSGVRLEGFEAGVIYPVKIYDDLQWGRGYFAVSNRARARLQNLTGDLTGHGKVNFELVSRIERNLPSWW